jgi:hypothetical protein
VLLGISMPRFALAVPPSLAFAVWPQRLPSSGMCAVCEGGPPDPLRRLDGVRQQGFGLSPARLKGR